MYLQRDREADSDFNALSWNISTIIGSNFFHIWATDLCGESRELFPPGLPCNSVEARERGVASPLLRKCRYKHSSTRTRAITLEYVEFPANTHVYALQLQRDFKSLFGTFHFVFVFVWGFRNDWYAHVGDCRHYGFHHQFCEIPRIKRHVRVLCFEARLRILWELENRYRSFPQCKRNNASCMNNLCKLISRDFESSVVLLKIQD